MKRALLTLAFALCAVCFGFAQEALSRSEATHLLKDVWMRDPYIYLHNDTYYLTYTTGDDDMPLWTSDDLVNWNKEGQIYNIDKLPMYGELESVCKSKNMVPKLWAPEIYNYDGVWYMLHTTNGQQAAIVSSKSPLFDKFEIPFEGKFGHHHDPSVFTDSDGSRWLVDKCAEITKFKADMSSFEGKPIKINPADRKMGHEGCQIIKLGDKYVWFGTAWSEDKLRHGTYNLYYATADKIEGPYSERQFAGYCLGHGTIFQDKAGNWWCTAFMNGALKLAGENKALTINKQGLTLVPMTIELNNGDVVVKANDPQYKKQN